MCSEDTQEVILRTTVLPLTEIKACIRSL